MNTLVERMQQLQSAEEFLEFFNIVYEQRVVDVYRLLILQGAHGLLDEADRSGAGDEALFERFRRRLQDAYAACCDGRHRRRAKPAAAPVAEECPAGLGPQGAVFIPLEAVMGVRRPRGA